MIWIALLIVFGIVIGNIMLVKHTANMKMPSLQDKQPSPPRDSAQDDEEKD